jgi:hypothetical protein
MEKVTAQEIMNEDEGMGGRSNETEEDAEMND